MLTSHYWRKLGKRCLKIVPDLIGYDTKDDRKTGSIIIIIRYPHKLPWNQISHHKYMQSAAEVTAIIIVMCQTFRKNWTRDHKAQCNAPIYYLNLEGDDGNGISNKEACTFTMCYYNITVLNVCCMGSSPKNSTNWK